MVEQFSFLQNCHKSFIVCVFAQGNEKGDRSFKVKYMSVSDICFNKLLITLSVTQAARLFCVSPTITMA